MCLFCLSLPPQSIDPGQQFTWEHSNLEVNKPKNRYANVIAYDHSRVILAPIEGKAQPSPHTPAHTRPHGGKLVSSQIIWGIHVITEPLEVIGDLYWLDTPDHMGPDSED